MQNNIRSNTKINLFNLQSLKCLGTLCETKINECSSEPCQNGGHCVDDVGAFRCVCSSGFEG